MLEPLHLHVCFSWAKLNSCIVALSSDQPEHANITAATEQFIESGLQNSLVFVALAG